MIYTICIRFSLNKRDRYEQKNFLTLRDQEGKGNEITSKQTV